MKHGLKQEIKRGLSVLMAASMVASSALPVMAEEVVEEAVEVEVVSEEVADEAGDVVVDVAEDAEVVEDVIDGETLEVITEEAADATCYHKFEYLSARWVTDEDGWLDNVEVTEKCTKCGETQYGNARNGKDIDPDAEYGYFDGAYYWEVPEGTYKTEGCEFTETYTATLYRSSDDKVLDKKSLTATGDGHRVKDNTYYISTPATCEKNAVETFECEYCGKKVTREYRKNDDPNDDEEEAKFLAQGHALTVKSVKFAADYKTATVTYMCSAKGCGKTVDIKADTTCVKKNSTGEWTVTTALAPSCLTKVTNTYAVVMTRDEAEAAIKKADKSLTDTLIKSVEESTAAKTAEDVDLDMQIPAPKNGKVTFEFDSSTDVMTAKFKCATCNSSEDHVFYSSFNNDYANKYHGDYKTYEVKVEAVKTNTAKATCADTVTEQYKGVLTIAGKKYESLNNDGTVKVFAKEVAAGVGHHSFVNDISVKTAKLVTKEPTCTENGKGVFYCTYCEKNINNVDIPRTGHTYTDKVIDSPATCVQDATYVAKCKECGATDLKLDAEVAGLQKSVTWCRQHLNDSATYARTYLPVYEAMLEYAKKELTATGTAGHNFEVVNPKTQVIWTDDYSAVRVTFTCTNDNCSSLNASGVTDTKTITVTDVKEVIDVEPGFDTKGSKHYEAVAKFNDKNYSTTTDFSKEWTYTAKSEAVEIPATGKQETATVSITGKTVTYNGNAQHVAATTNSDVKPVVSYYKDAACTTKFSSAPHTAGTYYVKATVAASKKFTAAESKVVKLVINKADPTVKVTPATKSVKNTKKNTINIKVTQNNINSQTGKVTYKASSSKIKVNSNGVVTVKKGTKKGTYKVTVTVKATTNYNKVTKTVKIKVK